MRKIVLITATAMGLGAVTISMPNNAQARFGAATMAASVATISSIPVAYYYRSHRRYPSYYGAYGYARGYNYYPPGYRYPGSREALDTCSFC